VRRRNLVILVSLGVLVLFAVSTLLARALSAEGAERSAITSLVQAEGRGDAAAAVAAIDGCAARPGCRSRVRADVAALHRPGAVQLIQLQTSSGFSLGPTHGTARVVWSVGKSLPIVQCVRVERSGNVLRGLRVLLLALTPRLAGDADCPARL
jgi:hypothetical protein